MIVNMDKKYNYIAMIPARGGSKSIPLKNIKEIAGQPLIYWSLDAAVNSKIIEKVFISTDSEQIKECVARYRKINWEKIEVIGRSKASAEDTASTEDVMLDFSDRVDYNHMVFIQATNPLITTEDIDGALKVYPMYDSVLSTVVQKRFYWKKQEDGTIIEIGHDIRKRPRRQDWDGVLAENGSIYIISKENLYKGKCRLYGRIGTYIMPEYTYYEIDEPSDYVIIENLLHKRIESLI